MLKKIASSLCIVLSLIGCSSIMYRAPEDVKPYIEKYIHHEYQDFSVYYVDEIKVPQR